MNTTLFDPFKKTDCFTLQNGLRVALYPKTEVNFVEIQLVVETGAIDDVPGKEGLVHKLEHMILENNPLAQTIRAQRNHMRRLRGELHSPDTGMLDMRFGCKVLPLNIVPALQFLIDGTFNLKIEKGWEKQTKIILREHAESNSSLTLNQHEDSITQALLNDTPHQVRSSVLGIRESIKAISLADLQKHFDQMFVYENAFLVVYGNITALELEQALGKIVMRERNGQVIKRNCFIFSEQHARREHVVTKKMSDFNPTLIDSSVQIFTTGNYHEHLFYTGSMFDRWIFNDLREKQHLIYGTEYNKKICGNVFMNVCSLDSEEDTQGLDKIVNSILGILNDPSSLKPVFDEMHEEFMLDYELTEFDTIAIFKYLRDRMSRRLPETHRNFSVQEEYEREAALTFKDVLKLWKENFTFRKQITVFEK